MEAGFMKRTIKKWKLDEGVMSFDIDEQTTAQEAMDAQVQTVGQDLQPVIDLSGDSGQDLQPVIDLSGDSGKDLQPVIDLSGDSGQDLQPVIDLSGDSGQDLQPVIDLSRDSDLSMDFESDFELYLEPDFEPDIRLEDLELAFGQGLSPKRALGIFSATALNESELRLSENEADTPSMFTAAVKVESCPDLEEELWKKVEGCHIASSQSACGKKDKHCNISGFSEFIRKNNKAINSKKSIDIEDENCSNNQDDIESDTADRISIDDEDEIVFVGKGQSGYVEGDDCCCGEDRVRESTCEEVTSEEDKEDVDSENVNKGVNEGFYGRGNSEGGKVIEDLTNDYACEDRPDASRDEKDNEEFDNADLDGEDIIGSSKSNEQELLFRSRKELSASPQNMSPTKAGDLNDSPGWIESSNQKEIRCEMNHLRVEQAELRAERADLRAERAYWRVERERLRSEYRQFKTEKELHLADKEQLKAEQNQLRVGQEQLKAEQEQLGLEQEQLRLKQEQLRLEHEQLRLEQEQLRAAQMQMSAEQEKLKAQQELMRTEQNINRTDQSPSSTEQKRPKDDEELLRAGQEEPVVLQLVKKEEKRDRQKNTRNRKNQNESQDTASASALSTHFSAFRTDLPMKEHKIPTSGASHTIVPIRDWQKSRMRTRSAKKRKRNLCSCQKNDKKRPAGLRLVKKQRKRSRKNNRNEILIKSEPTASTRNQNRNHDEHQAFTSALSTSFSTFRSEPPTKKRKLSTSGASCTSVPIQDWLKCGMTTRSATKCEKQSVTEQKWPKDDEELLRVGQEEPVELQLVVKKERRIRQKNTRNKSQNKSKHTASTSDLSTRNPNKNGDNLTVFSSDLSAPSTFQSDLPAKKHTISTHDMTTRSATRLKNGRSWQKNYLDYLDKRRKKVSRLSG